MSTGLIRLAMGGLLIYFSWHTLAGEQGLARWIGLQREAARLEADIAQLQAHRDEIEARLARLRDTSLDLDYIEEIARERLFMAHPDDIVLDWSENAKRDSLGQ